MTTQIASFSYEEVIDLHTEADRVSVIGIHTPTGDTPRKLCPGFFAQFRKYKYLGCKLALVPAATLPADPLQVSYESGEHIDPRDLMNPILWHGCHGNDIGDILNRLYAANAVTGDSTTLHLGSDSVDEVSYLNGDLFDKWDDLDSNISFMESLYYRALTDRTWKKANVQRGFRIAGLRPRVYSLASTMQIMGAASLGNIGQVPAPFEIDGQWTGSIQDGIEGTVDIDNPLSNANRFLTPKTISLGWLDTRAVLTSRNSATVELENDDIGLAPSVIDNMVKQGTVPVELPKIFMGVILLPPAYKQEFYFRLVLTHFFKFAGFRGVSMSNDMLENPNYHDWNDAIDNDESDDPTPDPEPEPTPEPEPEPTPEANSVVLSNLVTEGSYRTAKHYDSNAEVDTTFSYIGTTGVFAVVDGYVQSVFNATKAYSDSVAIGDAIRLSKNGSGGVAAYNVTKSASVGTFTKDSIPYFLDSSDYFWYGNDNGFNALFNTAME